MNSTGICHQNVYDHFLTFLWWRCIQINLKGYALCRRPPLSGRGLRGGGYVALAHLPCWVYWLLVVLSVLVFLWNVRKQVVFWRSFFMVFPLVAVTWHTNFIILSVQNLSFDRPGASIFPPWRPFCQLADTREDHGRWTMEGHMGAQNQIFSDFGWFWAPILKDFWVLMG